MSATNDHVMTVMRLQPASRYCCIVLRVFSVAGRRVWNSLPADLRLETIQCIQATT